MWVWVGRGEEVGGRRMRCVWGKEKEMEGGRRRWERSKTGKREWETGREREGWRGVRGTYLPGFFHQDAPKGRFRFCGPAEFTEME